MIQTQTVQQTQHQQHQQHQNAINKNNKLESSQYKLSMSSINDIKGKDDKKENKSKNKNKKKNLKTVNSNNHSNNSNNNNIQDDDSNNDDNNKRTEGILTSPSNPATLRRLENGDDKESRNEVSWHKRVVVHRVPRSDASRSMFHAKGKESNKSSQCCIVL